MRVLIAAVAVATEVFAASPEERTALETRTAIVQFSDGPRLVQYSVIDGMAVVEGDIVLGTAGELDAPHAFEPSADGTRINTSTLRWPNGVIPFTIDPALPDASRVFGAIAHWEAVTKARFVLRTTETDFVTFRDGVGCSSSVGRRGGRQFVTLGSGCGQGNAIHEIGHVVGLWHEQSRGDRDAFVQINFEKVRPDSYSNFNQHLSDGDDVGAYDYASIMHYPRNAFSVDGSDTLVPRDCMAHIGQRDALSEGDIAAAGSLLPQQPSGKRRASGRR